MPNCRACTLEDEYCNCVQPQVVAHLYFQLSLEEILAPPQVEIQTQNSRGSETGGRAALRWYHNSR